MKIVRGSTEYLLVDIVDKLFSITDLAPLAPKFDVEAPDGTNKLTAQTASATGMRLSCLVNTNTWDLGEYKLFVTFTLAPEIPRLGPFYFTVVG